MLPSLLCYGKGAPKDPIEFYFFLQWASHCESNALFNVTGLTEFRGHAPQEGILPACPDLAAANP